MHASTRLKHSPEEFRRLLGKRIRELREKRGSNQMEFAIANGIHPSMLSRIETGQSDATVQRIHHIAVALGTRVDKLLEGLL